MVISLSEKNVPRAYAEILWKLHVYGKEENSRNGPVLVMPHPFFLSIEDPQERVLFDPVRDANPFFHVMEFCWMLAGSNDALWLRRFNKRITDYADNGVLRGAYGWRWQNPTDQIPKVISLLRKDGNTRQAVLSMWDPVYDAPGRESKDRPCNTHIYFRINQGRLEMTVCNRSNDAIWGMMGSNVVHMTMLHEFISIAVGVPQGAYQVFTNNLHVYPEMPRFMEIYGSMGTYDFYEHGVVRPYSLLQPGENYEDLRYDCELLVRNNQGKWDFDDISVFKTNWMINVAFPMYLAYQEKTARDQYIEHIKASDWRTACGRWNERRKINS